MVTSSSSPEKRGLIKKFQRIFYLPILRAKARSLGKEIVTVLKNSNKILDLGCGDCVVTQYIVANLPSSVDLTPTDVIDTNLTNLKTVLYKGNKLPFKTNAFDSSYTIHTLHHCANEIETLKELIRVTRGKVAIIEEYYNNNFEKYLTYLNDWVANRLESLTVNIPFHFHSDAEWKNIFKNLGCRLISEKHVSILPGWIHTKSKLYLIQKGWP